MPEGFLNYGRQAIGEDDIAAVVDVLRSDWLTAGPAVERFEAALCEETGAKHAVVCNSGTAALYLASRAAGLATSTQASLKLWVDLRQGLSIAISFLRGQASSTLMRAMMSRDWPMDRATARRWLKISAQRLSSSGFSRKRLPEL